MRDPFSLVGENIGNFRVVAPVNAGGFGVVYRGEHRHFSHRSVAIKVLRIPRGANPVEVERFLSLFLKEAATYARLRHPAIVEVYDAGTLQREMELPYLILEWIDGPSLRDWLFDQAQAGTLPNQHQAQELLRFALEGLAYAHQENVAHRDVKPENILLTDAGGGRLQTRLIDFGIAKTMHDHARLTGATLQGPFTPQYGAPEQWGGGSTNATTGPWTDVFAVGLVITELLTGKPALDGARVGDFRRHAEDPHRRPTPRTKGAFVTDRFEAVCRKALQVDPRERFRTANDLLIALDSAAHADAALAMAPTQANTPEGREE